MSSVTVRTVNTLTDRLSLVFSAALVAVLPLAAVLAVVEAL